MKNIKLLFLIFCLLLTFINLSGCGYTTRSSILPYNTIYVAPFKNKIDLTSEYSEAGRLRTYYPLLETNITNTVVERFMFDGNLRIAKADDADSILEGELLEYRRDALGYTDDNDNVKEYRISITVSLKLWEKNKSKLIWQEPRFVGDTTYFVTGSLAKSESTAVSDAITDLARRIVERTVEQW